MVTYRKNVFLMSYCHCVYKHKSNIVTQYVLKNVINDKLKRAEQEMKQK